MPDPTHPPTLIHFRQPGSSWTACSLRAITALWDSSPGRVTCFICRAQPQFKTAQFLGVEPPTPHRGPRLIRDILAESTEMRDILKQGLNSGRASEQWAALTDLAEHFGLTYNEDTDTYS